MIPVFVTCFGRDTMLERCVRSLHDHGLTDVTLVDNCLDNTYRQLAPWGKGLVPMDRPYIVCDEDIEIDPDCPKDLPQRLLDAVSVCSKVGLQIRTDDVPDVPRYARSLKWERSLNARPVTNGILPAEVDTHFAIYAFPYWSGIHGVRLAAPYQCRHLPWYNVEWTEEEVDYYRRTGEQWAWTHSAGDLCTRS